MRIVGKSTRLRERLPVEIEAKVRYRESPDAEREATGVVHEATQHGVGFMFPHALAEGGLVHLSLPMPRHLRVYDFDKKIYEIWGVVRHAHQSAPLQSPDEEKIYYVGVAFIGKEPPAVYRMNPNALFDLAPLVGKNGLWVARQRPRLTF